MMRPKSAYCRRFTILPNRKSVGFCLTGCVLRRGSSMRHFSIASYVAHFGLKADESDDLDDLLADQSGFADAVNDAVDYWRRAIIPRIGSHDLALFILRTHMYERAVRCSVKSGLSVRLGAALSRIISDAAEQIVNDGADVGGAPD